MTSKLAQQSVTKFIKYFAGDSAPPGNPRSLIAFSENISVPFPVNEVLVKNCYSEMDFESQNNINPTAITWQTDLFGSMTTVGISQALKMVRDYGQPAPPPPALSLNISYKSPDIAVPETRFIMPESAPLTINGNYNFSVSCEPIFGANGLAGRCLLVLQIEFIQYAPIPFYQKLEAFPTRDDLEKLDRRQQTAAAILGVGLKDDLNPEPPGLRDLTSLTSSRMSRPEPSKRVRR